MRYEGFFLCLRVLLRDAARNKKKSFFFFLPGRSWAVFLVNTRVTHSYPETSKYVEQNKMN